MSEIVQRISMKAVIVNKAGKVLILRKAGTQGDAVRTGKYNLPGGRVEVGEQFKDALLREIKEETGLQVEVKRPIFAGEWHPEVHGVPHQIIGMFFVCTATTECVKLNEELITLSGLSQTSAKSLKSSTQNGKPSICSRSTERNTSS